VSRKLYFASFPAGTHHIVKDILINKIPDLVIHQLFEGAVLFETEKAFNKIDIPCFNNVFSVIKYSSKKNTGSMEQFISDIIRSKEQSEIIGRAKDKRRQTFRVIFSSENQLVSIDGKLRSRLEKFIYSQSGLIIDRENPDVEFWAAYRTEAFYYFMKRLTRHRAYEKILNKGELHPETAFLMNWLSEADKNDVFLDPFCGYGAIPAGRASNFPAMKLCAFDCDQKMADITRRKILKGKLPAKTENIFIRQLDIKNLDKEIPAESVDRIVTDPPWGLFRTTETDIESFYGLALLQMEKALKINGIMVLLLSRQTDTEALINNLPNLKITEQYKILVSGKKANLVKIKKINTQRS